MYLAGWRHATDAGYNVIAIHMTLDVIGMTDPLRHTGRQTDARMNTHTSESGKPFSL